MADLRQLALERAARNPQFHREQADILEKARRYDALIAQLDEEIGDMESELKELLRDMRRSMRNCIKDNIKTKILDDAIRIIETRSNLSSDAIIDQLRKVKIFIIDLKRPMNTCTEEIEFIREEYFDLSAQYEVIRGLADTDQQARLDRVDRISQQVQDEINKLTRDLADTVQNQRDLIVRFFMILSERLDRYDQAINVLEYNRLVNDIRAAYAARFGQELDIVSEITMNIENDEEVARQLSEQLARTGWR